MRESFKETVENQIRTIRLGEIVSPVSFSSLSVPPSAGFLYVSGCLKSGQTVGLERSSVFIEGGVGGGSRVDAGLLSEDSPLSVLGVREIKPKAELNVPVLIFQSADLENPDVLGTLRNISWHTVLVRTTNARALFDACMEHISDSSPGSRSCRTAAEELVKRATQTLQDLGLTTIRTALVNENIKGTPLTPPDPTRYMDIRDFYSLAIAPFVDTPSSPPYTRYLP